MKNNFLKKYAFLIISILMTFMPLLLDNNFVRNHETIDGYIVDVRTTTTSTRRGISKRAYNVDVSFSVDDSKYFGTLLYGKYPEGDTIKIMYNKNNPKEFTNDLNMSAKAGFIVFMFGSLFFITNLLFLILNSKFPNESKLTIIDLKLKRAKRFLLLSTLICIATLIAIVLQVFINQIFTIPMFTVIVMHFVIFFFVTVGEIMYVLCKRV